MDETSPTTPDNDPTDTSPTLPPPSPTGGNGGDGGSGFVFGGFLETSTAERPVWLMKCPSLVSRSMQMTSEENPSQPVAKVIHCINPLAASDDSSSSQFTMELAGNGSGNEPKSYSMNMSSDIVPMSVFSVSSEGKVAVEGKIQKKFDMMPHSESFENYGKLCRERTEKHMAKGRQTQVIDNDNETHMRPLPGMIAPVFSDGRGLPTKGSDTKRSRRDRGKMEEIIFKLFERQPNWTLRQLVQETDQPEQFLKDILKELCVYNYKGPNQRSYELKPEYKKKPSEEPASK